MGDIFESSSVILSSVYEQAPRTSITKGTSKPQNAFFDVSKNQPVTEEVVEFGHETDYHRHYMEKLGSAFKIAGMNMKGIYQLRKSNTPKDGKPFAMIEFNEEEDPQTTYHLIINGYVELRSELKSAIGLARKTEQEFTQLELPDVWPIYHFEQRYGARHNFLTGGNGSHYIAAVLPSNKEYSDKDLAMMLTAFASMVLKSDEELAEQRHRNDKVALLEIEMAGKKRLEPTIALTNS